jgi:riboflavin transporter FmnP
VLNYLLEVGGLYAATFYESDEKVKKDPEEDISYSAKLNKSVSTSSNIIIIGMVVGSLIALLFAASFVKDFSPEYVRLKSVPTPIMFGIEMILFGVISAVPIYFMAFNRDALSAHTTKEFLMITVKFAVLHCVLQASGFYRYMFTGKL